MRSDYRVYRYDRLDAPVVPAGRRTVPIGAHTGPGCVALFFMGKHR